MVQVGPKKASHRIRQETVLDALLGQSTVRFAVAFKATAI